MSPHSAANEEPNNNNGNHTDPCPYPTPTPSPIHQIDRLSDIFCNINRQSKRRNKRINGMLQQLPIAY